MGPAKSKEEEFEKLEELKFSTSNDSSSHETALLNGVSKSPTSKDETTVTSMVPPQSSSSTSQHSRQSSLASSTTSNEAKNQRITTGLGDCHKGLMVGLHRKMVKFSLIKRRKNSSKFVYFSATENLTPFHLTRF